MKTFPRGTMPNCFGERENTESTGVIEEVNEEG